MTKTAEFEFITVEKMIRRAKCPEDIFGPLVVTDEARSDELARIYRRMSKIVHPDRNGGIAEAVEAFQLLSDWLRKAERKLADGSYGDKAPDAIDVTIESKLGKITIKRTLARGDLCDVLLGELASQLVWLKVSRNPKVNGLVANEAAKLKLLKEKFIEFSVGTAPHFPELLGSFTTKEPDGRELRTNVFKFVPDTYTIEDVCNVRKLDPRDIAWMMNRALAAVATAHQYDVVHCAILPSHFLIRPEDHNGILIDWSYSIGDGEELKTIVPKWKDSYPPEVFDKKIQANAEATDVYMLGMLGMYMLQHVEDPSVADVKKMRSFFRSMTIASWKHRQTNVWYIHKDWNDLLERLYGARKWRPFHMPVSIADTANGKEGR